MKWLVSSVILALFISGCALAPGAGKFPMQLEPEGISVDAKIIEQDGKKYLTLSQEDSAKIVSYINDLRLRFQLNLDSLKKCSGN